MNKSPYNQALALAESENPEWSAVLDLLKQGEVSGDPRCTYAIGTWYFHGKSPIIRKNVRKGAAMIREAAGKNVSDALFDLANSYEVGVGAKKSHTKAFEYYVKAALAGDAQSYFEVGRMYFHGLGVKKNRRLADAWLEKAELLGVVE